MNKVEEAYICAQEVLHRCTCPVGFKASALPNGYPQVWGRDSSITALGALLLNDVELTTATRASLTTLSSHRTELGLIPLNVRAETGEVSGENAGAVDSNLWYILGHYVYHTITGDRAYLEAAFLSLEQALLWLRYQDTNACGLLEVPEAGDWADLFAVRYNTLYDNVLYCAAYRAMAVLAECLGKDASFYAAQAKAVAERINLLMWLDRGWDAHKFADHLERLKAMHLEWYMVYYNAGVISSRPYYLPYVAFREVGGFFDAFGNLLAILFGIADSARRDRILDYIHGTGVELPYPIKAFYPPIVPGDRDWREYYRSRNLNLPNQYHNGGIWPFLGGLYVAVLSHAGRTQDAEKTLARLAEANYLGRFSQWEFNEWLHGLSGRPMGYPLQAWSAAMYIYGYHALQEGQAPILGELAEDKEET